VVLFLFQPCFSKIGEFLSVFGHTRTLIALSKNNFWVARDQPFILSPNGHFRHRYFTLRNMTEKLLGQYAMQMGASGQTWCTHYLEMGNYGETFSANNSCTYFAPSFLNKTCTLTSNMRRTPFLSPWIHVRSKKWKRQYESSQALLACLVSGRSHVLWNYSEERPKITWEKSLWEWQRLRNLLKLLWGLIQWGKGY